MRVVSITDTTDDEVDAVTIPIEQRLGVEALDILNLNFDSNEIEEYGEMVGDLYVIGSYT